jgi:hypothetical protein
MTKFHGVILMSDTADTKDTRIFVQRIDNGVLICDTESMGETGQGQWIEVAAEQIEPLIEALQLLKA